MGNEISRQLLTFGQSILLGFSAGLLYDLLRALRLRAPRLTWALDSLYCLAVGLALFFFTLRRAQGQLRGYALLGALGGALLFFCLLSALLRPIWDFWMQTLADFLQIASIPARWMESFCKKAAKYGKYLFYFATKCYTIRKTGCGKILGGGGGAHGKRTQTKTARPCEPADQSAAAGSAGRHRLAAFPSARSGGNRKDRTRPAGRSGPDTTAGK